MSSRLAPAPLPTRVAPQSAPRGFVPRPVTKIEDTGLSLFALSELTLKIFYNSGTLTGFRTSELIALPFLGVMDQVLEYLKREKFLEIKTTGGAGFGEGAYLYGITGQGIERAREALARNQYAGPAPVLIDEYVAAIRAQAAQRKMVNLRLIRQALSDLVINERMLNRIGPAVNSGTSLFLYGAPGNGKTSIARAIGNITLQEDIYVPYAVDVDGQVIKVYDNVNHVLVREDDGPNGGAPAGTSMLRSAATKRDPRWVRIRRPFIVVGGELTLSGLDLQFNEVNRFYEAPFQMKANGGLFLIDDFGRQQARPRDLLNRWIVPLENRVDFLTLANGRKIEIPFEVLVVFSTNLPPKDLVDEAFLRRIRHKIEIVDPTPDEYRDIMRRMCEIKHVAYDDRGLAYLIQEWYLKRNRKLRANHPRDLAEQILDVAAFMGTEPALTKDLIDRAAESYFVEL
ncbi:MAG TPA: ATP-binding protein [Anaerolineales bacterium]|nr:ATP-binding protein [Anaerolineales bacterium]